MSEIRNSKLTSVEKKRVLSKIIALFKPYGIKFPIALITGLLGSVSTVAVSVFVKIAIDRIITPMMTNATMDILPLKNLVIQMGIVLLLGIIASYYSKLTMNIMAQNITFDIRNNLFSHMQYLPMSYYDKQVKGDLMSRFNNDVDTLVDTIAYALPNGFAATATIIGVMVAMVVINRQMALLIFIFVGAMILVVRKLASLGSKYFSRQQKSIGKVNGLVEEFVEGQRVIKVFNYQKRALTEFEVVNNELKKDSFEANRHAGIMIPTVMSMGNILYVLVAIVGGYLSINKGTLTIGDIAAFLQLTKTFTMPLNEVAENITRLMQSLAGINRIFEVIEVQKEPDFGTITLRRGELRNGEFNEDINGSEYAWYKDEHKYIPIKGAIEFSNVNFSYEDKPILKDVSFYADAGTKIAFVGATGAGKTTIINLITRMYNIEKGTISIDGINIQEIKLRDLREGIASVLQETVLFSGTVRDNIRYGRENATDEEVVQAAKLANAHGFISTLPLGYETIISSEGSELSKGQRQLIAIARAALADPPILILDEATSSIDSRTEKLVQDGMDKLMEGRTVLVIAHRLSTIRNSAAIMVMENGEIVERGNHNSLMIKRGIYYKLQTGSIELR